MFNKNGNSIWTHDYTILFVAHMFTMLSSRMMNTLLPLYYKELGATDAFVGFVTSTFYFAALIFRPFSGPAIDALNKKKLYITLSFIYCGCLIGYAIAPNINVLIVFRLLHGVSYGSLAALCLAMASAALNKENLASGVSIFALSSVLPEAIGPGIGLAISDMFGYRAVYLLCALSIFISGAFGFMLHGANTPSKKIVFRFDTIFAKEALVPALVISLMGIGSNSIGSFMAMIIRERGVAGLSIYYTLNAVLLVMLKPVTGKLADKYGTEKVIPVCMLVFIVHLVLLATCYSTAQLFACAVLNCIGYSSIYSLLQATIMKVTPSGKRGAASSTSYIGIDLGSMIGSNVAGIVAGAAGHDMLYIIECIPIALGLVIFVAWVRSRGGKIVAPEG